MTEARYDYVRDFLRAEGGSAIESFRDALSPRERLLLKLLYEPDDSGRFRTIDEIWKDFGAPKERLRAIERAAVRRIHRAMRNPASRNYLVD